ncbi:MAG: PEP-CTERM sorting domain-containing protein [Planctomycetaceae bacterium]
MADNSAFDTDATVGSMHVDMTTLPGWVAALPGTFDVFADNIQEKAPATTAGGGGQLNVTANYSSAAVTGYAAAFVVSASDLFVVHENDITEFSGSVALTGQGELLSAASYYSSSYPDPAPLPPAQFNFASYPSSITYLPPPVPVAGPVTFSKAFTDPPGNLGTRLRLAQTFTTRVLTGESGSVSMSTIVNPEPASVLLTCFGASMFGFGYLRRKKSEVVEA